MGKKIGFLESIKSPMNTEGFTARQLSDPVTGKLKKSRIVYTHRSLVEDVGDEITCDAPASRTPDYEEILDVDQEIQTKGFTLNEAEWRNICLDEQVTELQRYIADDLRSGREALDQRALTQASTMHGINLGYIESDAPSINAKPIEILTSDMANRPQGITELLNDWITNLQSGGMNVVGMGNIYKFLLNNQIGCCNDLGFDIGAINQFLSQNGFMFWLDQYANEVLGENNALVYSPGALQLLTANLFDGPYSKRSENNFAKFLLPDPVIPGLNWDVYTTYEPCADGKRSGAYSFSASLYWKMWGIPDDAYSDSDELKGMNNVFLYNMAQAS